MQDSLPPEKSKRRTTFLLDDPLSSRGIILVNDTSNTDMDMPSSSKGEMIAKKEEKWARPEARRKKHVETSSRQDLSDTGKKTRTRKPAKASESKPRKKPQEEVERSRSRNRKAPREKEMFLGGEKMKYGCGTDRSLAIREKSQLNGSILTNQIPSTLVPTANADLTNGHRPITRSLAKLTSVKTMPPTSGLLGGMASEYCVSNVSITLTQAWQLQSSGGGKIDIEDEKCYEGTLQGVNSHSGKRKGLPASKSSDHKTNSTFLSSGDSPLEYDENCSQRLRPVSAESGEDLFCDERMEPISNTEMKNEGEPREVLKEFNETKVLTPEEEIKMFEAEQNAAVVDSDTLNYLSLREVDYAPDPGMFERQRHITWMMRAILFDWMIEICMELEMKRETLHFAANFVDRYLSQVHDIPHQEFQLVGLAAMFIAAKQEEIFAPRTNQLANSANNGYSPAQIHATELHMLQTLKWMLTPPTLNMWANWYMAQWDIYNESAESHPFLKDLDQPLMSFKKPDERSYRRFREVMQLLDCALLDVQSLQYKGRALVVSFLYLSLGKAYGIFTSEQIVLEFPRRSKYLLDESPFNKFYGEFVEFYFGLPLTELLPTVQYAATYYQLPLSFGYPIVVKHSRAAVLEGPFEELLAYQTHNPNSLEFVQKVRARNIL